MLNIFERFVRSLTWCTAQGAQVALVFTMAIIVTNVILRIPWKPVPGTFELVEMSGAVLLALGVAYTAMLKGHISVGIFVDKMPPRARGVVDFVMNTIALIFTFILSRELFFYASRMMDQGLITGHLGLPIAPSIYLVAIGFIMLALVLLRDLLGALAEMVKTEKTPEVQVECDAKIKQNLSK